MGWVPLLIEMLKSPFSFLIYTGLCNRPRLLYLLLCCLGKSLHCLSLLLPSHLLILPSCLVLKSWRQFCLSFLVLLIPRQFLSLQVLSMVYFFYFIFLLIFGFSNCSVHRGSSCNYNSCSHAYFCFSCSVPCRAASYWISKVSAMPHCDANGCFSTSFIQTKTVSLSCPSMSSSFSWSGFSS